jgi:hypothetical protein
VVVVVGVTAADPVGNAQGLHTALPAASVRESEVAAPLLTCQAKVADCPEVIVDGVADRLSTKGTVTVTFCGPTVPPGPVAVKLNTVVVLTGTLSDPEVGRGPESSGIGIAGVIVTDVA